MEHPAALNEDFNLSTSRSTTVLELAAAIWANVRSGDTPLRTVSDPPFPHDVQRRVPSVEKAERLLGFKAETGLYEILTEVIPWIERAIADEAI